MVFQSLWNFAKRHRKKLLFTTVFAGGGYYAYRVWLPKIQEILLQRLLQQVGGADGLNLKTLLEELSKEGGEEDANTKKQRKKRAQFEHNQKVSNDTAMRGLSTLRQRHNACFPVEECSARLNEATTREAKLEGFTALQVECLSKVVSALYMLHLLLLLHRVELNIVGRELLAAEGPEVVEVSDDAPVGAVEPEDGEAHAAFLDSARYLQEEGVAKLATIVREAVKACAERSSLSPQTTVTTEVLSRFFVEVCRQVDKEFLAESQGSTSLLPESIEQGLPEAHRPKVKQLLDEARDYLESPQFLSAFQAVTTTAAERLANALGDAAEDTASAPLAGGKSCALAKLFGQLVALSNGLLDEEGICKQFATWFDGEAVVKELCEVLYFQEDPLPCAVPQR